jgi:adenine-specific DNA-methyltransferase
VAQGRFARVEEYAFFCFFGESSVAGRGDDLLTPMPDLDMDAADDGKPQEPRWKGLLRSGTGAQREDRKKMFYPVLIDADKGAVVGAGDPFPFEQKPDFTQKIEGYTQVWPVRNDGTLVHRVGDRGSAQAVKGTPA